MGNVGAMARLDLALDLTLLQGDHHSFSVAVSIHIVHHISSSQFQINRAGTELVTPVTPILSGNGPPVPFSVEMGPQSHSQWKWGITTHFQ